MRAPIRPAPNETEAQRLDRLDRTAMRSYSARHRCGGLTKRYHQDMADITNAAPASKTLDPATDK